MLLIYLNIYRRYAILIIYIFVLPEYNGVAGKKICIAKPVFILVMQKRQNSQSQTVATRSYSFCTQIRRHRAVPPYFYVF